MGDWNERESQLLFNTLANPPHLKSPTFFLSAPDFCRTSWFDRQMSIRSKFTRHGTPNDQSITSLIRYVKIKGKAKRIHSKADKPRMEPPRLYPLNFEPPYRLSELPWRIFEHGEECCLGWPLSTPCHKRISINFISLSPGIDRNHHRYSPGVGQREGRTWHRCVSNTAI